MSDIISKIKDKKVLRYESSYTKCLKNIFDISFSLLLLVITSPFLLIISLIVKIDSRGPIIFKQSRIGKNGVEFKIYKFRTMYTSVPKEGKSPSSSYDPRITKVGRFLRKTSLDELPQLFNIIKGEMSFIGPRPEQKSIVEQYYSDYEKQRFLVKPGITGPWQISMDRTKPIHENIHHDFHYISNISLLYDLKIFFQTVRVMIRSNTY